MFEIDFVDVIDKILQVYVLVENIEQLAYKVGDHLSIDFSKYITFFKKFQDHKIVDITGNIDKQTVIIRAHAISYDVDNMVAYFIVTHYTSSRL